MLVPLVNLIEQRFQLRVYLRIVNKEPVLVAKKEVAFVLQGAPVFYDANVMSS